MAECRMSSHLKHFEVQVLQFKKSKYLELAKRLAVSQLLIGCSKNDRHCLHT